MVSRKGIQSGLNVAWRNKVCADHLPLWMTVNSQLERKKEVFIAEWNGRTLMDRTTSRPERRNGIAALSETWLPCYAVWLIVNTHSSGVAKLNKERIWSEFRYQECDGTTSGAGSRSHLQVMG